MLVLLVSVRFVSVLRTGDTTRHNTKARVGVAVPVTVAVPPSRSKVEFSVIVKPKSIREASALIPRFSR